MTIKETKHEVVLGCDPITIKLEVTAIWHVEPMVMYYKDGSGHPGSTDLHDILIHSYEICGPDGVDIGGELTGKQLDDLFYYIEEKLNDE